MDQEGGKQDHRAGKEKQEARYHQIQKTLDMTDICFMEYVEPLSGQEPPVLDVLYRDPAGKALVHVCHLFNYCPLATVPEGCFG